MYARPECLLAHGAHSTQHAVMLLGGNKLVYCSNHGDHHERDIDIQPELSVLLALVDQSADDPEVLLFHVDDQLCNRTCAAVHLFAGQYLLKVLLQ